MYSYSFLSDKHGVWSFFVCVCVLVRLVLRPAQAQPGKVHRTIGKTHGHKLPLLSGNRLLEGNRRQSEQNEDKADLPVPRAGPSRAHNQHEIQLDPAEPRDGEVLRDRDSRPEREHLARELRRVLGGPNKPCP